MKVEVILNSGISSEFEPDEFYLLEDGYWFYYLHSGKMEPDRFFIEKKLVSSFRVKSMEVRI